eukprot:gene20575-27369_t
MPSSATCNYIYNLVYGMFIYICIDNYLFIYIRVYGIYNHINFIRVYGIYIYLCNYIRV